ncbi:GOLPH3/VPS74 family protein [Catenulispora yoronensis]|uniref:GOLPH3/VPS74 family protein n=1 Tax=Catenulispora yoronensis TaxID=450799 RepID=UPI0031D1524D
MLTQGEQLILIALDADKGVIRNSRILQYGLNAAVLSELLRQGLITLRQLDGRWGVTPVLNGEPPTGNPVLEAVWRRVERVTEEGERPHPALCVKQWLDPTMHFYLKALKERGTIDWEKPKQPAARYGRFELLDPEAAAAARARVDRVRTGAKADPPDRDLAAIAACLGLGDVLYPGLRGRKKRAALTAAVDSERFARILARALPREQGLKLAFESSRDLDMAQAASYSDDTP